LRVMRSRGGAHGGMKSNRRMSFTAADEDGTQENGMVAGRARVRHREQVSAPEPALFPPAPGLTIIPHCGEDNGFSKPSHFLPRC
jgi:hypothetical protein